jgi:hypothetical protein
LIIVHLYQPEYCHHAYHDMHHKILRVEEAAKRDGFHVHWYEGNGLITGVEFNNEDDAIAFIFKYLR